MENAVSQFLTVGTAIIAVIVIIIGFFVQRLVEIQWPNLKKSANEMDHKPMYKSKAALYWNEVILYALPVIIGAHIGWLVKEPYIFGVIATTMGRVFYAAVVGWFADFIYTVIQKALQKATGVTLPSPGTTVAVQQTTQTTTVVSSGEDAEAVQKELNKGV